ncbi:MAG: hypothetical protein Kow00124_11390 [Anaerolineae bacterium]
MTRRTRTLAALGKAYRLLYRASPPMVLFTLLMVWVFTRPGAVQNDLLAGLLPSTPAPVIWAAVTLLAGMLITLTFSTAGDVLEHLLAIEQDGAPHPGQGADGIPRRRGYNQAARSRAFKRDHTEERRS